MHSVNSNRTKLELKERGEITTCISQFNSLRKETTRNMKQLVYSADNIHLKQKRVWVDGKAKDEHTSLMLETV